MGRVGQWHLFEWLGFRSSLDQDQFLLIIRVRVQVLERTEAFTIKPQFLAVFVSRVLAVRQLLKKQPDFTLGPLARRMHQSATHEDGPNGIGLVLYGKVEVIP